MTETAIVLRLSPYAGRLEAECLPYDNGSALLGVISNRLSVNNAKARSKPSARLDLCLEVFWRCGSDHDNHALLLISCGLTISSIRCTNSTLLTRAAPLSTVL